MELDDSGALYDEDDSGIMLATVLLLCALSVFWLVAGIAVGWFLWD